VIGADEIRYLTAIDSSYYAALSEASKQSLKFQGGPFEGEALEAFEQDPLRDEMASLRRWDDQAKIAGIEDVTPRAKVYRGMIQKHLERV
jgi:2-amino-1-hydroxyethylphosphonate dioxygenase (glycine-forming)